MIIVKLIGGLGNQMFQYSFGRNLALKTHDELLLDITEFDTYKLHSYSLDPFNISARIATRKEVKRLAHLKPKSGRRWFLYNALFADPKRYVIEKQYNFDPANLDLKGPVYLDGYWQAEQYIAPIADVIRKDFSLKEPLVGKDAEVAALIQSTNGVSLHVRRGDFVSHPSISKFHGTCSPEYYDAAVALVGQRVPNPHLFVFSDDAKWAREHIRYPYPTTYVDHNDASKNYADLTLMSLCRHHITANSSFSWWGAWLNPHLDKVVVVPSQWVNHSKLNTRDLIPPSWIRI